MQEKREQRDCVSGDRNCQSAAHQYFAPKVHALLVRPSQKRKNLAAERSQKAPGEVRSYWIYLKSQLYPDHKRHWQPGKNGQ
jgi:hypothetical protein